MFLEFDPTHIAMISLTFLLAGFVKGVIGLGLPTVAMGLLSTMAPPAQAAALLIVPSLVTNVWQLLAGPALGGLVRRLWPMMVAISAGTLAGADFMRSLPAGLAVGGLGVALIVYAALGLSAIRFAVPAHVEWWLGPVIGFLTGLVTAATGVFVIPAVPYLAGLGLHKEELIQALGLSFTVSTLALAGALAISGSLHSGASAASVLATIPALAGMSMGGWVRGRVSEAMFRRCFFVGLAGLGLHLALRLLQGSQP